MPPRSTISVTSFDALPILVFGILLFVATIIFSIIGYLVLAAYAPVVLHVISFLWYGAVAGLYAVLLAFGSW